ncbi:hypothetical protein KK083_21695 [Fulvivirgaceae bacterium PWU4]|uniref:Uncharacterized protein n=1 Tax=Chryseosolibacter histidini TaxID=2782349 RepID=A0AAP2DQS7_9BACT|nr:hypothetical protein [Chryseosolibacter histidini]MBT1699527.1 hypothetical protein [Chryseosolibacter histidini]
MIKALQVKCVVMLAVLFLGGHLSMAQSYVSVKILNEPGLPVKWMKDSLCLTDEQASVVAALDARYAIRFDSLRTSHADRYAKFQHAYRLYEARDHELKFILTEQQFVVYQAEWEQQKASGWYATGRNNNQP